MSYKKPKNASINLRLDSELFEQLKRCARESQLKDEFGKEYDPSRNDFIEYVLKTIVKHGPYGSKHGNELNLFNN